MALHGASNPLEMMLSQDEPDPYSNHKLILELVKQKREEYFEQHMVFERQWQRMINYILGRQWIWWNPTARQWIDKNLKRWVPKPVTNIVKVALVSIRSMFADVHLNVLARPLGQDPQAIQTASVITDMAPVIHEIHDMDHIMNIADFWFIGCGNVFLHPHWDKSLAYGTVDSPTGEVDELGQPVMEKLPKGKGMTDIYSPFEIGGPAGIPDFEKWPGLMVRRWRDKSYFEDNHPELVSKIQFKKLPSDKGLQVFRSIAIQNDIDPVNLQQEFATGAVGRSEGIEEYELWLKPNEKWPQGLFARTLGNGDGLLFVDPEQSLPGPLPYTDVQGDALWPWVHGGFEEYGGRAWASGGLDGLIQKQDQINQHDSFVEMCHQRMANPIILIPKGSEIEKFTGEPGLVWKWNPLGPGGMGEPKRLEGLNPPSSFPQYREQLIRDAQEQAGTFDIVQGDRPLNVEAFSAIQALIERSQGRFKTAFKQRGRMYREWFKIAMELERQFGPDERIHTLLGPNRSWVFETFKKAQIQGAAEIVVEDGSTVPKTTLGMRAAIDQAAAMGLLNPADPDERLAMLTHFGLQQMAPSLDQDVKSALQEQDAFEKWVTQGGPMSGIEPPLRVEAWHEPTIHYQENRKWANSDRFREILESSEPEVAETIRAVVAQHLAEHQMVAMAVQQQTLGGELEGGARAMRNSNQESGNPRDVPRGSKETAQGRGPA